MGSIPKANAWRAGRLLLLSCAVLGRCRNWKMDPLFCKKGEVKVTVTHGCTLMDFYAKCGCIDNVLEVLISRDAFGRRRPKRGIYIIIDVPWLIILKRHIYQFVSSMPMKLTLCNCLENISSLRARFIVMLILGRKHLGI
ncbi:hypothetical protein Dimus_004687 [Dionaea muscipula]